MKIAIISDIHCRKHQAGEPDVRAVVEAFVDRAIDAKVDLLLDLGDRIDDVDRDTDLAVSAELAAIFGRFPGPQVHVRGNHDVVHLTGADHLDLFGQTPGHRVVDGDGLRVIIWEPSVRLDRATGFPPTASDLDWLLRTLAADPRPAIIVSHIPVSGAAMTGNFYFENNADFATYPDHASIRSAVQANGRVALWLSGHVHWNSVANVGGIRHVTIQSASERFATMPDTADAYALLEIADTTARLEVFGLDPLMLKFPFVPSEVHPWPVPRPRVDRPSK